MAGATVIIHSAGWLEGGLSVSYEKLVTDAEVLNMVAELCAGNKAGADEIGFNNALSHVDPSGHFFSAPQTMERYNTSFMNLLSMTMPISAHGPNAGQKTPQPAQQPFGKASLQQINGQRSMATV